MRRRIPHEIVELGRYVECRGYLDLGEARGEVGPSQGEDESMRSPIMSVEA